eukprot:TRINITY_DN4785_c0_g1_i1.p1 TRINITY_DN4785_c0_g1~~TRINITY_DN4785_c0_g1_i1.p1  ORF type:complete len:450 (+),score=100.14 TRINITY_DN4785_c0_g1_i1:158-1351(+)
MANVGTYSTGLPAGLICDRFGPKILILMALVLQAGGYLVAWAYASLYIQTGSWLIIGSDFVVGMGNTCLITVSAVTCSRNFERKYRGRVLGVITAAMALGGAVFAWLDVPFSVTETGLNNVQWFLLMLSCCSASFCLLSLVFVRLVPVSVEYTALKSDSKQEILVDVGFPKLLTQPSWWLLWIAFAIGTGCGLMFINNAGSVIESMGTKISPVILVTILSVSNTVGRLSVGLASDALIQYVGRAWFLLASLFIMCIAHAALAAQPQIVVYAAIPIGFAYGGVFSVTPTMISELFGVTHFGQNNGWSLLAPAAGSFSLNAVAGALYSKYVPAGATKCLGSDCFRWSFVVCSSLCVLAMILALALAIVLRRKQQLAKIIQEEERVHIISQDDDADLYES